MGQKYKFFIKEKSVIFSQDGVYKENDDEEVKRWVKRLKKMDIPSSTEFVVSDLPSFMKRLKKKIPFVLAGGGMVINENDEILLIHRRGYWDLPKGKQEKDEDIESTAIREVEEECGVIAPRIVSEPYSTYHLYRDRGKTYVKHSIWFRMELDGAQRLKPQVEEDITEAIWAKMPLDRKLIKGAYPSIRAVLEHFT